MWCVRESTRADPVALEADGLAAIFSSAFELAGVSVRAEQGRAVAGAPPGAGGIPSQRIMNERNFSNNCCGIILNIIM